MITRRVRGFAWLLSLCGALGVITCAGAADTAAPDERFDVEVNGAPAQSFFNGLVEGTHYNMLVHPDVTGTVTLKMKHVTVVEALDAVKELYGYDYRRVATGFVVLPATVQTRVFHVDYLDLERTGVSRTRVSSGQITDSGHKDQSGSNGSGGSGLVDSGNQRQSSQEVTGTAILTQTKSKFWVELETSLHAIVGSGPDRNVVINAEAGLVAVRATPTELRAVGDYLDSIQHTMTRQVLLEAKIVEVELSDGYQAGINWNAILHDGSHTISIGQSAPTSFDVNPLTTGLTSPVSVSPGNPVTGFQSASLGGPFMLSFDTPDFNAFIDLLSTQGNTRVLSSPRVSTLNNQKAVIKAGSDEFFVTDVSSNTVTGTASSTNRDVELTPFFSGVALDVTPQISDAGRVILHIHPTVSDVRDQVKSISFGGTSSSPDTLTLPLAFSEIRESDSIVEAKSGQVIVIGGLMRNTRKRQDFATPYLGRIPVLGNLFKSKRDIDRKTELVILLRPLVVGDKDWDGLVAADTARTDDLARKVGK